MAEASLEEGYTPPPHPSQNLGIQKKNNKERNWLNITAEVIIMNAAEKIQMFIKQFYDDAEK